MQSRRRISDRVRSIIKVVAADRSIHLISGTCKCQFIGETFVYLRAVPAARLGIKTANKTILLDIKTRVDNRAGRFRLIKGV